MKKVGHQRTQRSWIHFVALLIILISFTGSLAFGEEINDGVKNAPINPRFLNHLNCTNRLQALRSSGFEVLQSSITDSEKYKTGYRPSPIDTSYLESIPVETDKETRSLLGLAASYDLRTLGRVTPVGNQNPAGSCWAFASIGSLESCLLPEEPYDFSENNLKNTSGFDLDPNDGGGNGFMSTAYFTRWSGPVFESEDRYNPTGTTSPAGLQAKKHIQEVLQLPDRNKDQIKNAIITYGGVATSMAMVQDALVYNETKSSYWLFITDWWKRNGLDHMVLIVGWDDNYSRYNFNPCPPNKGGYPVGYPAGNGAWIVKNSWGTNWGDNGYFYVSYYDNNFARELFVFNNAESTDNYQLKHEYDPYGKVNSNGYGTDTAWMANVFTASPDEVLTAVGTYANAPNTTYTLKIYRNVGSSSPISSDLVLTQSGTFTKAGYHTVKLSKNVPLPSDEKFSVVFKITTPGYNYPIPSECRIAGKSDPQYNFTSKATNAQGQSYISKLGTSWSDMYSINFSDAEIYDDRYNACIKAYGTNRPIISTQPASQTVDAETDPTFTVELLNNSGVSYQWYFNDMEILGATGATLTLTDVSPQNNGEYYVVATNDHGSVQSEKATLTVRPLLSDPLLDLQGGTYTSAQNVSVFSDGYTGVTFRYTTNGTDPTSASPVFSPTTPLKISTNTTLKVRAFKTDYTASHVVTAVYTITGTVAKPTISLPSGTYSGQQLVRLSCTTLSAVIRYTLDGYEPTNASTAYDATKPILITGNVTLNAKAFKDGWNNSPTATATYILAQIAPPTFSVSAGVYSTARSVILKSGTTGATIYYTVDGTDPVPPVPGPVHGKAFTGTAIAVTRDTTIKAVAYKPGFTASQIAASTYYIGTAPAPKFSLANGGTYQQDTSLTITDSESTAGIYYTTDGSTPTDRSTFYDQPIQLTKNVTIKALAYSPERMSSAVVTATYKVVLAAQPQFSVAGGSYTNEQTVTVTCTDPDAVIRYTTNNTEPLATSPAILPGQDIQVKGPSTVLKAKAFKTGWSPSATTTATYKITTVGTVATPKLSPAATSPLSLPNAVTVSCSTAGSVIRYTDNGTTPTGLSPIADSGIIPLTEPKTIKVRAFKDGMASSAVVSATYTSILPTPTLQDAPTNGEQTVTILSTVVGATIRYTLDGTEPTTTSRITINGQVLINKTLTLKAKVFKSGWVASKTLTQKFSITQVASPTFSVASGTYQTSKAVVVKCATVPATGKTVLIHYTLDGTDPTATSSPTCAPGATITISATNVEKTVTLKAMAVESGLTNSNIATATYYMTGTVAKPTLDVISKNILQASGTYASGLRVYVYCATENAEIHYTTDGTTPTISSPVMSDEYILVEYSCKLNVKAFKTDWLSSAVTSETYTILQVATPVITIADRYATISCATPGAVICYTTNGNDPIDSDPVVTSGSSIRYTAGMVLKVKAWKTGLVPSMIATPN